jgi:hypothetical protein
MFKDRIPDCIRALLLGACCVAPLSACDAGVGNVQAAEGDGRPSPAILPSAEREARHFDLYNHYRATFDRPRHLTNNALQDDGGQALLQDAVHFLSGASGACSSRGDSGR